MRSDGLLHRIGNMLREKVTVAAAAEEEEAGGRRRTERGRDGARKKFGVLTRTWSTRRHYCLLNNRAKVPPPKGTLAPRSTHARRAHVDPNSSIHVTSVYAELHCTDTLSSTPLLPTEESSRRSELVHPFRVPHEVGGGDRRVDTREHLLEAR
eukprot:scaffold21799_cov74-Phaeocystis_antarctica.AAC.2